MTERERLIELFMQADAKCDGMKQCEGCVGFGEGANCVDYLIVDHLLANGVIVPPCKVGDTVYCVEHKSIHAGIVTSVKSIAHVNDMKFIVHVECEIKDPFYNDGRKMKHGIVAVWGIEWGSWHMAFPTIEEAEKALEERGKS